MRKLKHKPLLSRLSSTLKTWLDSVEGLVGKVMPSASTLTMVVLIVLCLMLFASLSGCAPKVIKPTLPPQAEPREMPLFTGSTWRDSILYLIEVREWGMACEYDKSAIRYVFREGQE